MNNEPKEGALDLALWRYGIISALLHRDANDIGLYPLLDQLAQQHYVRPDGKVVQLRDPAKVALPLSMRRPGGPGQPGALRQG